MEHLNETDFYFIYEDEKFNEEKERINIERQVQAQNGLIFIMMQKMT